MVTAALHQGASQAPLALMAAGSRIVTSTRLQSHSSDPRRSILSAPPLHQKRSLLSRTVMQIKHNSKLLDGRSSRSRKIRPCELMHQILSVALILPPTPFISGIRSAYVHLIPPGWLVPPLWPTAYFTHDVSKGGKKESVNVGFSDVSR